LNKKRIRLVVIGFGHPAKNKNKFILFSANQLGLVKNHPKLNLEFLSKSIPTNHQNHFLMRAVLTLE